MSETTSASGPRVTRWSSGEPLPDERQLRARLTAEGMAPYTWGNPPRDRYDAHRHNYHKVLYCLSGSITFVIPGTDELHELHSGDRLDLPSGVEHSAIVGDQGVVCLEGHRLR